MKKALIIISLISISLCLSELSFAKKSKRRATNGGLISTTARETGNVAKTTGKAAVDITESAVQTPGKVLRAL